MGAKNKVIDGDYKGKSVVPTALGITIVLGLFKKVMINESTVENYEVFDSEKTTSAASAMGRGALGGFFLGPIGLLAATSAKKKGVYVIAIQFKDGKRSLIEVNEKVYKQILLLNFRKDDNSKNERSLNASSNEDIVGQIEKLAKLKDSGILTEEEFSNKKTELLSKI
ncbi:SHOCT domain-containing protein [Clostridium tetani]|uniref:SHOCT domain-containing protein n=1 Tax=Clostridium tetani TaxID=1513 RepID=UPI0018F8AA8F|nr:SHOCT domain-containing protein [Clostridium tetani]